MGWAHRLSNDERTGQLYCMCNVLIVFHIRLYSNSIREVTPFPLSHIISNIPGYPRKKEKLKKRVFWMLFSPYNGMGSFLYGSFQPLGVFLTYISLRFLDSEKEINFTTSTG